MWPFIVASLRHTCAIILHLDTPHLRGGWIMSAKEKCSLQKNNNDKIQKNKQNQNQLVNNFFEWNRPFVYIYLYLLTGISLYNDKTVNLSKNIQTITCGTPALLAPWSKFILMFNCERNSKHNNKSILHST